MTPEFDEEVVFEVGAGATRGGLGPCLSAPRRGVAPRPPGAVCAGRPEVTVGREAGAGPGREQRLPAGGGGREPAGPAGRGGARWHRRDGVGCPALRRGPEPRRAPPRRPRAGPLAGGGTGPGEAPPGMGRSFVRRVGGCRAARPRVASLAWGFSGGPCRRVFPQSRPRRPREGLRRGKGPAGVAARCVAAAGPPTCWCRRPAAWGRLRTGR